MCDICRLEKTDIRMLNGKKSELYLSSLYRVYESGTAQLKLCRIHSIELFSTGEKRFMLSHRLLVKALGTDRQRYLKAY